MEKCLIPDLHWKRGCSEREQHQGRLLHFECGGGGRTVVGV